MELSPEQVKTGKANFAETAASTELEVGKNADGSTFTRRDFLKGAAAAGTGLGAYYFGYKALDGDPVKVGFIGTGDEGNVLISEHPPEYMEIVAIADLRPANIERTFKGSHPVARRGLNATMGEANAAKVKTYKDHKELIAAKDELGLEAVVVAVPLSQHAPIVMEALNAGLHVLCEKLMAHNVTECKEMIRAARDNDRLLTVGHQRHYSVLYDNANFIVKQGLLGDIRHIHAQWHRNNSFPGRDSWRKWKVDKYAKPDTDYLLKQQEDGVLQEYGYDSAQQLVDWRLYNATGGGLMAELGSHQMDACSIFLGKVHPVAVQGYGGRNFYGVKGVGSKDKQADNRDIDDHVYVTLEFPGQHYHKEDNPDDICVVTYSSLNTNSQEGYGETILGSRGTMLVRTEKDALLFKESSAGSPGGVDQRLWVVNKGDSGPVLDSYETTGPSKASAITSDGMGEKISRGYREEMEHFCHCIRTQEGSYWVDGNPLSPDEGGPRCNGVVAMADAIMALTSNLAMKHKKRIEFKDEWFDFTTDAAPETDEQITG